MSKPLISLDYLNFFLYLSNRWQALVLGHYTIITICVTFSVLKRFQIALISSTLVYFTVLPIILITVNRNQIFKTTSYFLDVLVYLFYINFLQVVPENYPDVRLLLQFSKNIHAYIHKVFLSLLCFHQHQKGIYHTQIKISLCFSIETT